MIEVRPNSTAPISAVAIASSKGGVDSKIAKKTDEPVAVDAEKLRGEDKKVSEEPSASLPVLLEEVAKVNEVVQSVQRNLQFTVDEDLDRTVIRVVDGHSGELIRQIPEDIFLELARRLQDDGEMNLLDAMG